MSKKSTDAVPATDDDAHVRDYIVVKGQVDKGGDVYATGATIALTDAEAEYPLSIGVVRLKDAGE